MLLTPSNYTYTSSLWLSVDFDDDVILLTIQDPVTAIINKKIKKIHSFIEDIFCAGLINISENAAQKHYIPTTRDMAHPINMLAM